MGSSDIVSTIGLVVLLLIAAAMILPIVIYFFLCVAFLIIVYLKLYLYTSVFDRLLALVCSCTLGYHYPSTREMYQTHLRINKQLEKDKEILKGTFHIIIYSDVDIYSPNDTVLTKAIPEDILHNSYNIGEATRVNMYNKDIKYQDQSLIKTLKLKYGPDFTTAERKSFADHLLLHVVLLFQNVIKEIQSSGIKYANETNNSFGEKLLELPVFEQSLENLQRDADIDALHSIWMDSEFQKCYSEEKSKGMSDCLDYLFDPVRLQRIFHPDFLPTNEDIEKMNIPHDFSLTKNIPLLEVIVNLSEKRKVHITQYSQAFRHLKHKLPDLKSPICDLAIFIGRAEKGFCVMNYLKSCESAICLPNNIHDDILWSNLIFLDERLLSVDKFQAFFNCISDANTRCVKSFKNSILSKFTSLFSIACNTIKQDDNFGDLHCYLKHY